MKYLWFMFLDSLRYQGSMWSGRLYGHFRVRYPDGQFSQTMFYPTARDYASMFDGQVVLHSEKPVK